MMYDPLKTIKVISMTTKKIMYVATQLYKFYLHVVAMCQLTCSFLLPNHDVQNVIHTNISFLWRYHSTFCVALDM